MNTQIKISNYFKQPELLIIQKHIQQSVIAFSILIETVHFLAFSQAQRSLITSAKEVMFLPVFVCLSVCLSVCLCVRKITQKVMDGSF